MDNDKYEKIITLLDLMGSFFDGNSKLACEILKETTKITELFEIKLKTYAVNAEIYSEETLQKLLLLLQNMRKELEAFGPEALN